MNKISCRTDHGSGITKEKPPRESTGGETTAENIFTMEEHNKLYDKANTDNMVKYFINVWSYKNGTGYQGMKQNSFSKQQCINKFKSYISKNRNLFN